MHDTLSISLHGTTQLPRGKIATIVTSLEMRAPPERSTTTATSGRLGLDRMTGSDLPRYLALYRELGWRWMWFSRLVLPQAELAAILDDPAVEAYAVSQNGHDIGLLEFDRRIAGEVEIAFFGLLEGAVGQGIGAGLMAQALELAWAPAVGSGTPPVPISRVWVHTCTFDHPGAVRFYQRCGFTIYQLGVEVADDPRLAGHLPLDAAPHVPVLR
ncbi:MAG: GNAT family N-acetyltransferase [Bosea sp. (in: a-proteobacteria)]